jgi:hydrogenase maturation factor
VEVGSRSLGKGDNEKNLHLCNMIIERTKEENLDKNISFYIKIQSELKVGKWVLIHNQTLVSVHDSFESAAQEAVRLFSEGPYLIRQVGAPNLTLPASVVYNLL